MPVSTSVHLGFCLDRIIRLSPASVLDVGCGFGTWGFLCRLHLDVFHGRVWPNDWRTRIDGIELFAPYIMEHQRFLYSSLRIADIREAVKEMDEYDLIIAGDVIEHLHKDDAEAVLDALYAKAKRALLVNIPIGEEGWEHPEQYGNPGELHRSTWSQQDFFPYPHTYTPFQLTNGDYGIFFCPKDVDRPKRMDGLIAGAEYALEKGRSRRALALLRGAHALAPQDSRAALALADCALQCQEFDEAVRVLEASLSADPASHSSHLLLAQLQHKLGNRDAARSALDRLLQYGNVAPELREQAQILRAGMA